MRSFPFIGLVMLLTLVPSTAAIGDPPNQSCTGAGGDPRVYACLVVHGFCWTSSTWSAGTDWSLFVDAEPEFYSFGGPSFLHCEGVAQVSTWNLEGRGVRLVTTILGNPSSTGTPLGDGLSNSACTYYGGLDACPTHHDVAWALEEVVPGTVLGSVKVCTSVSVANTGVEEVLDPAATTAWELVLCATVPRLWDV